MKARADQPEIDWSLCTWDGSRRAQHRAFLKLPFRSKLEVIEELGELAVQLARSRVARGLPVVGPAGKPFRLPPSDEPGPAPRSGAAARGGRGGADSAPGRP